MAKNNRGRPPVTAERRAQRERFGRRFKYEREGAKLSLLDVAKALEIGERRLISIEAGEDSFPAELIYKAADLFGIARVRFLDGDPTTERPGPGRPKKDAPPRTGYITNIDDTASAASAA